MFSKLELHTIDELAHELSGVWEILMKIHDVLRSDNMVEQSNCDSGETQDCPRKLSRSILGSLPVFWTVPSSKSRVFGEENNCSERPLKTIP